MASPLNNESYKECDANDHDAVQRGPSSLVQNDKTTGETAIHLQRNKFYAHSEGSRHRNIDNSSSDTNISMACSPQVTVHWTGGCKGTRAHDAIMQERVETKMSDAAGDKSRFADLAGGTQGDFSLQMRKLKLLKQRKFILQEKRSIMSGKKNKKKRKEEVKKVTARTWTVHEPSVLFSCLGLNTEHKQIPNNNCATSGPLQLLEENSWSNKTFIMNSEHNSLDSDYGHLISSSGWCHQANAAADDPVISTTTNSCKVNVNNGVSDSSIPDTSVYTVTANLPPSCVQMPILFEKGEMSGTNVTETAISPDKEMVYSRITVEERGMTEPGLVEEVTVDVHGEADRRRQEIDKIEIPPRKRFRKSVPRKLSTYATSQEDTDGHDVDKVSSYSGGTVEDYWGRIIKEETIAGW